MSVDVTHLTDPDSEFDGVPRSAGPLDRPIKFLAGDGLQVSQTGDRVQYALSNEFIKGVRRQTEAIAATVNFGFKVSVVVTDAAAHTARVTIAAGMLNDMSWSDGSLIAVDGWFHREHEIIEGALENVQLPCLIYGMVPLEDMESDGEDVAFNSDEVIEGNTYHIRILQGAAFKQVNKLALPATASSIFQWKSVPPVASGDYFQFRVADINENGSVEKQWAVGSVTVPQLAGAVIHEFDFLPSP